MADVEKVARATLVERLKAWRSLLAANHYTEKVALLDEALAAIGEREAVAIRSSAEPPAPTPLTPSIPNQR